MSKPIITIHPFTPSSSALFLALTAHPQATFAAPHGPEAPFGIPETVFLSVPDKKDEFLFGASAIAKFLLNDTFKQATPLIQAAQNYALQRVEIVACQQDSDAVLASLFSDLNGTASPSKSFFGGAQLTIADKAIWALCHFQFADNTMQQQYPALHVWYKSVFGSCASGMRFFEESLRPLLKEKPAPKKPKPASQKLKIDSDDFFNEKLAENLLPQDGKRNILITSALPYVNNVPHLGNIIGCVLSADVYARYARMRGYNVLYVCGTDEYGTATETKALEEGLTCQEICDKYNAMHVACYDWFGISFNYFGRTTTQQQTEIAQDIFLKLKANDLTTEHQIEQLYCKKDDRFLADRFVFGTCPDCKYEDARGDQCDKCGHLINAIELINPRCKLCNNTPEIKTSRHLFVNLPELQQSCDQFFQMSSVSGYWSSNGIAITDSWLKQGLQERCITRDLKWGTPVPMAGFESKVFYVWFDAPIGYLSITANYTKEWEKWWKNPEQVELFQFMGKDNVPFHTVIFPCSLIGTKDNYTLLHHLSTTEYLNYEDGKFSKSRNYGVFGNTVMDSGIPADIWRFYLLSLRPEANDTRFEWVDMQRRVNSALCSNLGNLVNRCLRFLQVNFQGEVPHFKCTEDDLAFIDVLNGHIASYMNDMEKTHMRSGLETVIMISSLSNEYMANQHVDNALFQRDPERCGTVIALIVNVIYHIASLLHPFMPETSKQICEQLFAPLRNLSPHFTMDILPGHCIGQPQRLFAQMDDKMVADMRAKYGGAQEAPAAAKPAAAGAPAGKQMRKKGG